MARFAVAAPLILLLAVLVSAQNPPQSDPQAVAFASQSIAALTGGNGISDVTLTGTVTWNGSGSDSGTATLRALGTGESRMDLVLTNGTRTEIRDASTGMPLGQWLANGASGLFAPQNCATDAVWFFPALGSLANGPNVVLSYVGQEMRGEVSVQHLQSYIYQSSGGVQPGPTYQQLSTSDFYLDAGTLLPVATVFNAHPDDNANTNLRVEIDFSNYQAVNGFLVPMHIQRFLQGSLTVDLAMSSTVFNAGLPLSVFAIN